jgi:hypothetical protein
VFFLLAHNVPLQVRRDEIYLVCSLKNNAAIHNPIYGTSQEHMGMARPAFLQQTQNSIREHQLRSILSKKSSCFSTIPQGWQGPSTSIVFPLVQKIRCIFGSQFQGHLSSFRLPLIIQPLGDCRNELCENFHQILPFGDLHKTPSPEGTFCHSFSSSRQT